MMYSINMICTPGTIQITDMFHSCLFLYKLQQR